MAGTTPHITPRMRMRMRKLVDGFDNLTLKNQLWLIDNAPDETDDDSAALNVSAASHAKLEPRRDVNDGPNIPPAPRPTPHEGVDGRNLVVALELAGASHISRPPRLEQ